MTPAQERASLRLVLAVARALVQGRPPHSEAELRAALKREVERHDAVRAKS